MPMRKPSAKRAFLLEPMRCCCIFEQSESSGQSNRVALLSLKIIVWCKGNVAAKSGGFPVLQGSNRSCQPNRWYRLR